MTVPEIFRNWYEQEADGDQKILSMLESVPAERQDSEEYRRALNLATHLVACRKNWLARIRARPEEAGDWWPTTDSLSDLRERMMVLEAHWTEYFAGLTPEEFNRDFEYELSDGKRYRWNVGSQLMQLVGHAFYHRGQIAILVDMLDGKMVDTDYLYWVATKDPRYGRLKDKEPVL